MKVRIALAINEYGEWHACGSQGWDDDASMTECMGNISETNMNTYFVTVDVPVPKATILAGQVENDYPVNTSVKLHGSIGTIYGKTVEGLITVKWDNGNMYQYPVWWLDTYCQKVTSIN